MVIGAVGHLQLVYTVWYGCNSSAARERAMKAMTGAVYLKFEFPERRYGCAVGVRGPGTAAGPRSNDDHGLGDTKRRRRRQRRVLSS